jgi:hypothetical protein
MGRLSFRTAAAGALVAGLVLLSRPVHAEDSAPAVPLAAPGGGTAVVLAGLESDPRQPEGYSADLELHVKLRSFPFIGLTVHGTSEFRRPGQYHYVLRNVPRIAGKFDDLRYDLGDPVSWAKKYDISMAPQSTDDAPVLRLTPKHQGLVTALDIETDANHGRMLKATWKRKDGGKIVLTQTYSPVGQADVVLKQHAEIDIPHMRAEVTATYSNARSTRRCSPPSPNADSPGTPNGQGTAGRAFVTVDCREWPAKMVLGEADGRTNRIDRDGRNGQRHRRLARR